MPKAPASQWFSMLDPAKGKGTKADEMKWIGLDDFLKDKQHQMVTKKEIQDFIGQNKVELKEVTKGKDKTQLAWTPNAHGNVLYSNKGGYSIEKLPNGKYR